MSIRKINNANEQAQPTRVKIIGQVFDVKGYKIAGAKVTCNGEATTTLFDGSFEFNVIAPSTHRITVAQQGFTKQSRKIEVMKEATTTLSFHLRQKQGSGTIHGYVYDSESKTPIPSRGTVIMVLPVENRHVGIHPKSGEYKFPDLPPGKYHIFTSVLEYEDESREISLRNNEKKRVDFFCSKIKTVEPPWG
ncbi:MAG: carboxypeptidase-like regulatory domain-containing protein [Candidatus Bathyarchaeota archaeon]|nr:MAG: carboxypeptidase-like regulatory domain-containing protein [Candidatus Bathyarchaeota archaeon]